LYCEPDGRFPFHPADPTKPENLADLKAAVLNGSLDIGFAFDGDGDRIGVVTPEGQMLWGDVLMALCAQEILQFQRGCCVQDVKCSMMFTDVVNSLGGTVVTSATGYALVQQTMKENNALFGGEQSSHLSFADNYFGFDDGLYTAIRLLPTIADIDERVRSLPHYFSTPELRIPIDETKKVEIMGALKSQITDKRILTIDGLRPEDENGWALIRPSNTEAVLTVRVEGKTESDFRRWSKEVAHWLKNVGVPSKIPGDLL
jgi:phosphomannomutase